MAELQLVADLRPTAPAPVPLDPDVEPDSRLREVAGFVGAVALGALVLAGRTMARRPFATVLVASFGWAAASAGANLARQPGPHPAPLFARAEAAAPEPARERRPAAIVAAAAAPDAPRERADLVRDLQSALARRGHYQGVIDGRFGPRTERAVRAAEAALGLAESGRPSEQLLARLRPPPASPERTASIAPRRAEQAAPSEAVILVVQRRLADMGYAPGRLTGVMTPEFRRAVERFQRDNDLAPTGAIDQRLVERLAVVTGPIG